MMLDPFKSILFLISLLCCGVLCTPAKGGAAPARTVRGVVVDSSERTPLIGASVWVFSARDTLAAVSATDGSFRVEKIRDTIVTLRIAYLGYKEQQYSLRLRKGVTAVDTIALSPDALMLDEATVEATPPLMGQRGDTIVFHATQVQVLPGDETMEVVKRLPGIQIKEDQITFQGKTISRTYVDKKPLFGKNAPTALRYLEAREVIDIEVYDELTEEDQIQGRVNGQKRTVMNLVTRSKPDKSLNLRAHAGLGATLDADQRAHHAERHRVNASVGHFSTRQQWNVRGESENNAPGAGYGRNTQASVNYTRNWEERLSISGNYNYSDAYNRSQTLSQRIYFPTSEYTSRRYDDTSRTVRTHYTHAFGSSLRYVGKYDVIYTQIQGRTAQERSGSYRGALNQMDGEELNRVGTHSTNQAGSYSLSENLHWNHAIDTARRHNLSFSESLSLSNNDNHGWQIDSLASTTQRTYLENRGNGFSRSCGVGASYGYRFTKQQNLELGYQFSYDRSSSLRIAEDHFTGEIDTSLSYRYSRNYTTHQTRLNYGYYAEKRFVAVGFTYQANQLHKDETFPEQRRDRILFQSFQPSVMANFEFAKQRRLFLNYNTSAQQPSIEQLRNELNYNNPLWLTGGNPDLRQSYSHSLSLSYAVSNTAKSRMINLNLNADLTRNQIATRQQFFAEATPLPQYNGYIASKGATLSTPVNVNGAGSVRLSFYFSQLIKPLKGTLGASLSANYNRQPSYVGALLNYTNRWSPQLEFSFQSTESRIYQFSVNSSTSYSRSSNSQKADNNTLNQSVGTALTLNFFKKLYTTFNYNYTLYHNFTYADGDVNTHHLNLSVGYKFFKNRSLDVHLSFSDLLQRVDNFSTRTEADYISYTWRQRAGRYFMFHIGYRLNQLGKRNQRGGR